METPSRMEALLDSVKQVKDEFYVGTAEAYKYVTRRGRIYNRPYEIAQTINQKVSASGQLIVPATPERITGILAGMHSSVTQVQEGQSPGGPVLSAYIRESEDPASCSIRELFRGANPSLADFFLWSCNSSMWGEDYVYWSPSHYFGLAEGDKEYESALESSFTDLFGKASRQGITTEGDLGLFLAEEIRTGLQNSALRKAGLVRQGSLWNRFKRQSGKSVDEALYEVMIRIPWGNADRGPFSKRYFEDFKEVALSLNTARCLNIEGRINRLENDQVDHRLEYRRNLIASFVRDWPHEGWDLLDRLNLSRIGEIFGSNEGYTRYSEEDVFAEVIKESERITDDPERKYLGILSKLDGKLRRDREELKTHEDVLKILEEDPKGCGKEYDDEWTYEDDLKFQKDEIRRYRAYIKEKTFIRHLLGSEKRFVIKFMDQR